MGESNDNHNNNISISTNKKKVNENNIVSINLDSQNKITTKINLNKFISTHLKKIITAEIYQI